MTSKFTILTLLVSVIALSACASGTSNQSPAKPTVSANDDLQTSSIDRAMETALAEAEANGNKQEILAMLQRTQARNPNDAIVATRYAQALREDEQINSAIRVLKPFTQGDKANVQATTEMAMAQLALGDFPEAEKYASQAIEMDNKNSRAFLALGTAQDAQGDHKKAEIAFRDGLKYSKGNGVAILNNLALNLASQGHLEESLTLIEKAQGLAPGRLDLEKNRRIIATLLETTDARPPSPVTKPKAVNPPKAKPYKKKIIDDAKNDMKGDAKVMNLNPRPQPVKVENKATVEKKIEAAADDKKMDVTVNGVTKLKTNIKLKPLNN